MRSVKFQQYQETMITLLNFNSAWLFLRFNKIASSCITLWKIGIQENSSPWATENHKAVIK